MNKTNKTNLFISLFIDCGIGTCMINSVPWRTVHLGWRIWKSISLCFSESFTRVLKTTTDDAAPTRDLTILRNRKNKKVHRNGNFVRSVTPEWNCGTLSCYFLWNTQPSDVKTNVKLSSCDRVRVPEEIKCALVDFPPFVQTLPRVLLLPPAQHELLVGFVTLRAEVMCGRLQDCWRDVYLYKKIYIY